MAMIMDRAKHPGAEGASTPALAEHREHRENLENDVKALTTVVLDVLYKVEDLADLCAATQTEQANRASRLDALLVALGHGPAEPPSLPAATTGLLPVQPVVLPAAPPPGPTVQVAATSRGSYFASVFGAASPPPAPAAPSVSSAATATQIPLGLAVDVSMVQTPLQQLKAEYGSR